MRRRPGARLRTTEPNDTAGGCAALALQVYDGMPGGTSTAAASNCSLDGAGRCHDVFQVALPAENRTQLTSISIPRRSRPRAQPCEQPTDGPRR